MLWAVAWSLRDDIASGHHDRVEMDHQAATRAAKAVKALLCVGQSASQMRNVSRLAALVALERLTVTRWVLDQPRERVLGPQEEGEQLVYVWILSVRWSKRRALCGLSRITSFKFGGPATSAVRLTDDSP